jgi:hypothetical protein
MTHCRSAARQDRRDRATQAAGGDGG